MLNKMNEKIFECWNEGIILKYQEMGKLDKGEN